jgi:capsular exopolysaccharide synthesis family protein
MSTAPLDFPTLGTALLRRKWTILSVAAVVACTSVAVTMNLPRRFTSEGGLIVENQQPNIPDLGIQASMPNAGDGDVVPTAIDVLKSPGALESVVRKLDLAHVPSLHPAWPVAVSHYDDLRNLLRLTPDAVDDALAFLGMGKAADGPGVSDAAAVTYLQEHLRIHANDHSNLLSIQFTAGSPDIAAAVVNALMSGYIDTDIAARRAALQQANAWLTDRARDLAMEVDADNQRITRFLQDHDTGQLQGGSVAAVQLSGAQERLAAARANLERLQASLDTATRSASHGAGPASTQEVLGSPVVQALRQREADLLQRLAGLPPMHPDRARLEGELQSIRGQIGAETAKITAALTHETEVARINVQQLEQAADQAALDARDSSVAQADYQTLIRNAEAKRAIYNSFLMRADQARVATMQFPSARIEYQARPADRADGSSRVAAALLGFLGGIVLASAGVIATYLARGRLTSTRDIALATGLPVFGSLPDIEIRPNGSGAPSSARPRSSGDETLRAMWLAMRSMTTDGQGATVVVASSEVGEGKTTVAAALGRRVAADGFRVMLIDTDLRRPGLSAALGLRPTSDLASVLTGATTLQDAVVTDPETGLDCLLGDGGIANPTKVLASNEFGSFLAGLRRHYDLVILDSPPVMRVADAVLLSELSQFTLFVVAHGRVAGRLVTEAISRFPAERQKKVFALLTRVPDSQLDRRDYYGGYGLPPSPYAGASLVASTPALVTRDPMEAAPFGQASRPSGPEGVP